MTTSEKTGAIYMALIKASGELKNPPKNATNPHFRNRYADLAVILETVKPCLLKNGLAIIQGAESEAAKVTIITRLLHESGEWIETSLSLTAGGADPQKIGSAITYGRRYSISALLNIVADDDDDGNEGGKPAPKKSDDQKQIIAYKKAIGEMIVKIGIEKEEQGLYCEVMCHELAIDRPLAELTLDQVKALHDVIKADMINRGVK